MRARGWNGGWLACAAVLVAGGAAGCKSVSERYIALEVWKYEKCFGHLPPGFVPPGAQAAAGPPGRVCGQNAPCASAPACDPCQGGAMGGAVIEGSMPAGPGLPAGTPVPAGGAGGPTPAGATVGRPIVISDEVANP